MKLNYLKFTAAGAGLLGAGLRWYLYATGLDEKGLLVRGHWAGLALVALTVLVGIAFAIGSRRDYPERTALLPEGAGAFLCAGGFLMEGVSGFSAAQGSLDLAAAVLCLFSGVCLVYIGISRLGKKRPHYLSYCVICLCFALRMISHYRLWSSDPQLMDYCFFILAHVCLMLTGYQLAATAAGEGNSKKLTFFSLCAGFLSLVCLFGQLDPLFMGLCGVWALTAPKDLPREETPC